MPLQQKYNVQNDRE